MVRSLILSSLATLSIITAADAAPVKRYRYTGTVTAVGTRFDGSLVNDKKRAAATVYQKAKSFKVIIRSGGSIVVNSELKRRGNSGTVLTGGRFVSPNPAYFNCVAEVQQTFTRTRKRARHVQISAGLCDHENEPFFARSGLTQTFTLRQR